MVAVPATPVAACSEETVSSVAVTLQPAAGPVDNYVVVAGCSTVTDADGNCPHMSTGLHTTHVFSKLQPATSYTFTVTATANKRRSTQVVLTCRTLEGRSFEDELLKFCFRFLDQELIPYRYSSCCSCCGDRISKKQRFVVSNRIGMKFSGTVLQVNTHQSTTEWCFWCDVILSRWRPCICSSVRGLRASCRALVTS